MRDAERIVVLEHQVAQLQAMLEEVVVAIAVSLEAVDPTGQGATQHFLERIHELTWGRTSPNSRYPLHHVET